jgi:hypothetical protein
MTGFGSEREQICKTTPVPTEKWILLAGVPKISLIRIRNMSHDFECMYTWDKDNPIGAIMEPDEVDILDNMNGLLYGKGLEVSVLMNVLVIPIYRG